MISYESIFLDFVSWNFSKATLEGLKEFKAQPAWLVVRIWNYKQKKLAEKSNLASITTAKLTLLIRAIADSFSRQRIPVELDDFLPFRLDSFEEEEVTQETIDIYQYYSKEKFISGRVKQAIAKNSNLCKLLSKNQKG